MALHESAQHAVAFAVNDPDLREPPGHGLGYDHPFVHELQEFLGAVADGRDPSPSFADGLQVQRVLEAVQRSAENSSAYTEI